MVNSESMDSPGDGNAKDCITQLNSVSSDSHSPSPVTASSLCLREMDFANETAEISTTECGSPMDSPPETAVMGEEENSRLTTETENVEVSGLYCSVPLNKVQDVLNSYTIHLNNQTFESNSNSTNSSAGGENRSKKLSRKLLCLYCDRTFVTTNLRQKHVDRCHSVKQARRYSSRFQQTQSTTACIFCSKLNSTDHSLKELFMHLVNEHSNKYFACVDCEERFIFKSHLEEHDLKTHDIKLLEASDDNAKDCDLPEETRPRLNGAIFTHDLILDGGGESNENQKTKIIKTKHKTKIKNEITATTTSANKIIINTSSNRPNLRMSVRKELRKKKVGVKSTKVGVKRNTRLQAKITQTKPIKKRTKNGSKVAEKNNAPKISETNEKSTGCVNPYPTFDAFFRVKKITDHSIDNLKISSLTFDDVFDKAFYNRIKCNIQENLQNHIDGKLFKNEESESRISNFEKMREVNSSPAENFGCELTLNAATPVVSLLSTQFGEDLESQIEYGSKASKKKPSPKTDEVHYKYFTRRKYQASILESKENRDLSKLDMWTQLLVKNRQQKIINDKKTEKEKLEYIKGDEYRTKMKNEELNRILDRRGPFEDLKEEANKKAAMEKLCRLGGSVNCEAITDVTCILNDLIDSVIAKDNQIVVTEKEELNSGVEEVNAVKVECDRDCEIPYYLKLRQSSSLIGEPDVDRSDRITLICSSQETENFEECNVPRDKNVLVELSGEWTRSRIFICAACGVKVSHVKMLLEHKSIFHQNVWVQHYEFVGNQSELYRDLSIPGLGKVGYVEDFPMSKVWKRSDARFCTKCSKTCNSLAELHRHVLECGEDWSWMLARKKLKYRPFGAKSRRKRRGLVKRILHSKEKQGGEVREKKKYNIKRIDGPRPKPSDADTIQRMLANLPAKRASRKIISLKDGFPKPMKRKRPTGKNLKQDQMQSKSKKILGKTKKALQSMKTPREIAKNCNQVILRKSVRNINKVFSSKLLDTNSALIVKRKIKTALQHHRITRSKRELPENQDEIGDDLLTNAKTEARNSSSKGKQIFEIQDAVATSKLTPLRRTRSTQNLIKFDSVDEKSKPATENTNEIETNDKVDGGIIGSKLIRSLSLKKLKKSKGEDAKLITQNNLNRRDENGSGRHKVKNGKRKSSLGSLKKAIKKIKLREKAITSIVQVDGSSQINDEILPFLESIHLSDDRDDDCAKTNEIVANHKPIEETNHSVKENVLEPTPIHQTETISEIKEQKVTVKPEEITIKTEVITPTDVVNVAIVSDNKVGDVIVKPKIRKRVKGLNDCIAMLTSKLQQKVGEKFCVSNGEVCNVTELMSQQKTTEFLPSPSLPLHFRPPTPPHSPNPPPPQTPPRSPAPPSSSLPLPPRPSTLPLPPSSLPTLPPPCLAPSTPTFSFPPPSFPSSPLNLFTTKNHIQQIKFPENQNGMCENNFASPQNEGKLCNILNGYTFGENLAPSFYENVGTCFRNISKLSGLIATETPTLKDDDNKKVDRQKAGDDKLTSFIDDLHQDTGKFKEVDVNIEIDLIKCLEKVGENDVSRVQDEKLLKKKKIGKFNDKRKENINVITRDNFVEAELISNHANNENGNDLSVKTDDVVLNNGNDSKITTSKPKKKICRKKTASAAIAESKTIFTASLVVKINNLTNIDQAAQIDDVNSKEADASITEKLQKKRGKRKKIDDTLGQYDMTELLVEEQEPELMENKSLDHLSEINADSEGNVANDNDFPELQTVEESAPTKQEEVSKKVETDSEDEVPLALLVKNTATTVITTQENPPESPKKISEDEPANISEMPRSHPNTDFIEQNKILDSPKSSEPLPKENGKKRVKSTERKRKPNATKKPDQKDVYDFDIDDEDRIARKLKISTAIFQTKNKGLLFPARETNNAEHEEEDEEENNKGTEEQPPQVQVLEVIKTEPEANDEDIPDVRYCCEENIEKFAPKAEEAVETNIRLDIMICNENYQDNVEFEQTPETLETQIQGNISESVDIPRTEAEEIIIETLEMNLFSSTENHEEHRDVQRTDFDEVIRESEESSEMNFAQVQESHEDSTTTHLGNDDSTVEALEMKIRRSIMLSNEKLKLEAEKDLMQDNSSNISEELQIIKDIIAEAEQDLIQQANNNGFIISGGGKIVKKNKKCKKKNQDKREKAGKKRANPIKTKTKPFSLNNAITSPITPIEEDILLSDEGADIENKFLTNQKEDSGNGKSIPDDGVILSTQVFLVNNDEVLPVEGKVLQDVLPEFEEIHEKHHNDEDIVCEPGVIQQKLDDVLNESFGSINIEQELSELENKENLHSVNKDLKDAWEDGLLLNFGPEFEEYEIQEMAADAKMSNKITEEKEKPDEARTDLKLTIDISEMNHPIVLNSGLKSKMDKEQMDLSEESEKPAEIIHIENNEDKNDPNGLDTSISCSQQNDLSVSDASSINKTIAETKDTSNISFNNSTTNSSSKRAKRKGKSKTVKVNVENSSFNFENQIDSFVQTPDLNDSEIAAKIKAQFKVKMGSKKNNRNRKTSLEKLYCDICDKMFVRCDNLVKHRRTLTHIAKLSELEAKEAAEKAKANAIESNDTYKMNINISDILNKSDKEPEPDLNNEMINKIHVNSSFMLNTNSDTLKLADIINDVLNKPVGNGDIKNYSDPTVPVPMNSINKEPKRYKSLGERKSFESDINSTYSFNNLHMREDIQLPKLSTNADSILKHPISISILENIIENQGPFDYIDDITVSSDKSVEEQLSRNSPSELSVMSDSKQYDSNQITFTHNTNIMNSLIKPGGLHEDNFVKPTQYEEISNDSSSVRNHFDDPKQRKALNRDEELFLECCSLLKSSSEVSSYSKKSCKNVSMVNNFEMKPADEPDWLERKSFSAKNQEFRNDAFSDSCPNTPLGDGFGDEYSNTNSNTIASNWNNQQKEQHQQQQQQQTIAVENPVFEDISLDNSNDETVNNGQNSQGKIEYNGNHFRIFASEKYTPENAQAIENSCSEVVGEEEEEIRDVDNDLRKKMVSRFGGLMAKAFKNSLQAVKKSKLHKKNQHGENTQTSITDYVVPLGSNKAESDQNDNKKMLTKGAMKVFEGLKVSIPTDDLDIKELLNGTVGSKKTADDSVDSSRQSETESVPTKAMKMSMKFGNKLGLKVTKKKHALKMRKSPSPKCKKLDDDESSKKTHDVYDFEETQDNTEIFNKSNFTNLTTFRNQIIEKKCASTKPDTDDIIVDSDSESNNQLVDPLEAQSVLSFSTESNMSVKKPKQKNITKKKCMIMGRIFKNAFKSKIEDDIRDIPVVDNSKLVEDYVMQLPENDKEQAVSKMTENEMDLLFDKLLLEQNQAASKKGDEDKASLEVVKQKLATTKPKPRPVAKRKRQRQYSDSTDDEFNIGKPRKRNTKKKQNNADDGINLEQELKECIGVASRKSQRKCTSGKQNVLVEFWSSDDSNFDSLFYGDPVTTVQAPELEVAVVEEIRNDTNNEPDLLGRTTEDPIVEVETRSEIISADSKAENVKPKIPKVVTTKLNKQARRKSNAKQGRNKNDEDKEDRKLKNIKVTAETLAANRRKRVAADTLYYWSSSSEDESQDLIEVKPIRDEIEEEDDRPIHHGWIVGDSPKKLVTMLAQAKGKKVDAESVKEQGKKRTTL